MFGTAVVDRAVRYRNREGRAAVQETRGAVHFCDSSAVCGGNNHRDRRLFGVIIGFFSPPPQDTQSQTRPMFGQVGSVYLTRANRCVNLLVNLSVYTKVMWDIYSILLSCIMSDSYLKTRPSFLSFLKILLKVLQRSFYRTFRGKKDDFQRTKAIAGSLSRARVPGVVRAVRAYPRGGRPV